MITLYRTNAALPTDRLWRVVAPHYVAGVITDATGVLVKEVAPILKWALYKDPWPVLVRYFRTRGRGWSVDEIGQP